MSQFSGGSRFSRRSTTPSSTARAAPTEMPISCHVCQSLLRNTTALELAASPPRNMAASSSSSLWTLHPFLYDPRCWLEWAGTSPRERCFGGLPFASSDFRDFRAHGPRMRIDDLSASNERFIARVTATVTIDDCRSGRGEMFPAAGTVFASVFTVPSEGGTGSEEAPAAATSVARHAPSSSSTSQRADSTAITDPAAFAP